MDRQKGALPRQRGYTLVEIMIVVLVGSLILAIAVPSWAKLRTSARIKDAEVHLNMLSAAVEQLVWDTGEFPNGYHKVAQKSSAYNVEVWHLAADNKGLTTSNGVTAAKWQGPYIPEIPHDPWGNPYFFDPDYRVNGVNKVVVGSFGPNGVGQNVYDKDDIYVIIE